MHEILNKKGFICDMDGVIYHGNKILDGVKEFVNWMIENDKRFVFLTNSAERTPHELSMKLHRMGLEVSPEHFYTSAMATAQFLSEQKPGCTAYVIGEAALTKAMYDEKIYMNDINPDYVVFGETRSLNYEKIEKAVKLVMNGAKLIGTNTDLTAKVESGIIPACRALISPIEMTTGRSAYYIGKPNPLMMRHALKKLDCHRVDAAIIGDRMDTDILSGIESELDTVLVLTGVTNKEDLVNYAYAPKYVLNDVGDIVPNL